MTPTAHPSNNFVLPTPEGVASSDVGPLSVTRVMYDRPGLCGFVSYWQPNAEELRLLKKGRAVYLSCLGDTIPPVYLGVDGDGTL